VWLLSAVIPDWAVATVRLHFLLIFETAHHSSEKHYPHGAAEALLSCAHTLRDLGLLLGVFQCKLLQTLRMHLSIVQLKWGS
jgi:hypothetical protein